MYEVFQLPDDIKRVLAGQFSADTRHLGVSQAANELGKLSADSQQLEVKQVYKKVAGDIRHS